MKLGDMELTVSLMAGEEEEKFLQQAVKDMKERRGKFQKGQKGKNFRGKPSFNRKRRNDEAGDGDCKPSKTARESVAAD